MTSNNENTTINTTVNAGAPVPSPVKIYASSSGVAALPVAPQNGSRHHQQQDLFNYIPSGFGVSASGLHSIHPTHGSTDDYQSMQRMAVAIQSGRAGMQRPASSGAAANAFYPSQAYGGFVAPAALGSSNFPSSFMASNFTATSSSLPAAFVGGQSFPSNSACQPRGNDLASAFYLYQSSQNAGASGKSGGVKNGMTVASCQPSVSSGMRGLQQDPATPHQKEQAVGSSADLPAGDAKMKGATASLKRSIEKTGDASKKAPKKIRSPDPVVSFVTKLKKAGENTGTEDLFALFVAEYPPENNQFYSLRELTEHVKSRDDSPLYEMKVESLWNSLKDSGKVHPKLCQSHLKTCFARFNKTSELPLPGARFAKEQQEMAQGDKVEQFLASSPQLPPGFFDSKLAILCLHYQDVTSPIFGMPAWDLAEALAKKKLITITPARFFATFLGMVEFDKSLRVLSQQWFPHGLCKTLFNELSLYLKTAVPHSKIDIYRLFCKHGFGWVPELHLSRFCDALHVLCLKTENGKVA